MAGSALSGMPPQSARYGVTVVLAVMAIVCASAALAQSPPAAPAEAEPQTEAQPSSPQAQPSQSLPPLVSPLPQVPQPEDAPPKRDGFFDALNRWMEKSQTDFKASIDESNAKWRAFGAQSEKAAKDAAAAQKEAVEAFKNLSNIRVVEGRQICLTAANGSPDCQAAAEVICRNKGFGKGQSADIQTTRKCSAKAFLNRSEDGCRTETVVIKAACQ